MVACALRVSAKNIGASHGDRKSRAVVSSDAESKPTVIASIQLLRNIGKFDSVAPGPIIPFRRLTLLYAENGRGKTTLAAILRSLGSGVALPIEERHRLTAANPPHAILATSDAPSPVIYQNGAWSRTIPSIAVFDDTFVNENVYSGLMVEPDHRKNLHDLILGAQGVALNRSLQGLVAKIETHNLDLRAEGNAIPPTIRGPFTVEEFCNLAPRPDIDRELHEAEQSFAAVEEYDAVINTAALSQLPVPSFDPDGIRAALAQGIAELDATAAAKVREHIGHLPARAEPWIAEGLSLLTESANADNCPFCSQSLSASSVFAHYGAYFGREYAVLQGRLGMLVRSLASRHGEEAQSTFERSVSQITAGLTFWSRFVDTPSAELNTEAITRDWRLVRHTLEKDLQRKQVAPLEVVPLSTEASTAILLFNTHRDTLIALNHSIDVVNSAITALKQRTLFGNAATVREMTVRLRATKARHQPEWTTLCSEYLSEKAAKGISEGSRDAARQALDHYRSAIFPSYQTAINLYLERFGTGFCLSDIAAMNARGGPTCRYNVVIDTVAVPVAGGEPEPGEAGFRNTLSAGDRNALALAFFFASLDQSADLGSSIVVIDDPMSSLDDHRTLTTARQIRTLATQAEQVIVLSHSKSFLAKVWSGTEGTQRSAIELIRNAQSSKMTEWRVDEDSATEHDRRHAQLVTYVKDGIGDLGEIARAIRPHLEGFLRVAVPKYFPPGTLLGHFTNTCRLRLGTADQILNSLDIAELDELVEYANRFHHEPNGALTARPINDAELERYATRALKFTLPFS